MDTYFYGCFEQERSVEAFEEDFEQLPLGPGRRFPTVLLGSEAESDATALASPFVQDGQRHEESHLQHEQHQNADHGADAERSQSRHTLVK